jgi:hypothetical protein
MESWPNEKQPTFIESEQMKDFIQSREISSEDFPIIEELLLVPKSLIISRLHNTFNMLKDRAGEDLKRNITEAESEEERRLCELFLILLDKYGWATCWNLMTVLEKQNKTQVP